MNFIHESIVNALCCFKLVDVERIFIEYLKVALTIEELEDLLRYKERYEDYEHFLRTFDRFNLYQVAYKELIDTLG